LPSPKKILSKLASFDRARKLTLPEDRILVAISGGPDSVALGHYLFQQSVRRAFTVFFAHIHHGLRGAAADRDAAFARDLAKKWGIACATLRIPVARKAVAENRSLEDAARSLRYRALAAHARKLGCAKVAVGHHLDDQAETVLLHILRGTKAKGLAGMPVRRPLAAGVELLRPFLAISREDVLSYLAAYRLPYRIDKSNSQDRFTRNWIRRRVLPLLASRNPKIREHLARIAEDLAGQLRGLARQKTDVLK